MAGLLDLLSPQEGDPIVTTTTGSQSQNVTSGTRGSSQTDIPAWLRPLIRQGSRTAGGALRDLRNLTRGDLVADLTPDQLAAHEAIRGFGTSDPFMSALNALQSTARGDFLFGGPGQQSFIDAAVRSAQPGLLSVFGNRSGGGLAKAAIAQQAQDAFANLFNQERGRQLSAASALPGVAMLPIQSLLGVGNELQAQEQREIDAPMEARQRLLAASLGIPGAFSPLFGTSNRTSGTTSTTGTTEGTQSQPTFNNPLGSILGLGLGGLGLASGLGGTLFGTDALASGGLLGLFGGGDTAGS